MEFSMASAPELTRMVFFGKLPGASALSFSARATVADVEAADAAGEIEIAIAVNILDGGAFGARGENRRGIRRTARNRGFAARYQCAGLGARYFRAKLNCFHFSVPFAGGNEAALLISNTTRLASRRD